MGITVTTSSDYENWLQSIDSNNLKSYVNKKEKKKNNIFTNIKYVLQFTTGCQRLGSARFSSPILVLHCDMI